MNILTFDIEDWYCHDNISRDMNWEKFESRIEEGVDRILDELDRRNLKATFFCLGWLAEHHAPVIRKIADKGHQIGCHSYQHELASRFTREEFKADLYKAKSWIEDTIGKKIELFRAPAFSITEQNLYALEVLAELGFTTDCSVFPAVRDFGGMPDFGEAEPVRLVYKGIELKEFPINLYSFWGKKIIFSGGGYFRLLPYPMIKCMTRKSPYVMTYFHPSDFDPNQPKMKHLPKMRQWKNEIGLETSFAKFKHYLDDFDFVNLEKADDGIDWNTVKKVDLTSHGK